MINKISISSRKTGKLSSFYLRNTFSREGILDCQTIDRLTETDYKFVTTVKCVAYIDTMGQRFSDTFWIISFLSLI